MSEADLSRCSVQSAYGRLIWRAVQTALVLGVAAYWPAKWLEAGVGALQASSTVDAAMSPTAVNGGMVVAALGGIATAFLGALAAAFPPAAMVARPTREFGFGMLAGLGVRFFVTLSIALIVAANLGLVGLAVSANSYLIWTAGAKFVFLFTGIATELSLARRLTRDSAGAPAVGSDVGKAAALHAMHSATPSNIPEATC